MDINHIHFYVNDARAVKDWFVGVLGFRHRHTCQTPDRHTEIVDRSNVCCLLTSPRVDVSQIADYVRRHPPGVADIAFRVTKIEQVLIRAIAQGAKLLQPLQIEPRFNGTLKWAKVRGWGDLSHTLIENDGLEDNGPLPNPLILIPECSTPKNLASAVEDHPHHQGLVFTGIDHAVLNVASGDLEKAVSWYEKVFGFQRQQQFSIQTQRSALRSQVLTHPQGTVRFPINEPASASSQIQEFLDVNQGPGIQHVALHTPDILTAIAQLRTSGVLFLQVPQTYYQQLQTRPGFQHTQADWRAIAQHEVLVDWADGNPGALLLQTFTQPIFDQPTFFFELIQRQSYIEDHEYRQVQGFGEGNFQALFEAIEREQIKRGSLD